jgi:hypothetical protein
MRMVLFYEVVTIGLYCIWQLSDTVKYIYFMKAMQTLLYFLPRSTNSK